MKKRCVRETDLFHFRSQRLKLVPERRRIPDWRCISLPRGGLMLRSGWLMRRGLPTPLQMLRWGQGPFATQKVGGAFGSRVNHDLSLVW